MIAAVNTRIEMPLYAGTGKRKKDWAAECGFIHLTRAIRKFFSFIADLPLRYFTVTDTCHFTTVLFANCSELANVCTDKKRFGIRLCFFLCS